jgi:hypothetical protein
VDVIGTRLGEPAHGDKNENININKPTVTLRIGTNEMDSQGDVFDCLNFTA